MTLPFPPPAIWPEPATRRQARAILIHVIGDDTAPDAARDTAMEALGELDGFLRPGTVLMPVHPQPGTLAQARRLLAEEDITGQSIPEFLGVAMAAAHLNPWAGQQTPGGQP